MQVIFTSNSSLFGRAIRYFTKRSWIKSARVSHIALRLGGTDSKWMVEATLKNGFGPNWWPKFLSTNKVTYIFEMIGCDEAALTECMEDFIEKNIWEPYDWLDILGMSISVIWYWATGKKIKNIFKATGALTCTESAYLFMSSVFQKTGIRFFKERDPRLIFPEDQLIECADTPDRFKLLEAPVAITKRIN